MSVKVTRRIPLLSIYDSLVTSAKTLKMKVPSAFLPTKAVPFFKVSDDCAGVTTKSIVMVAFAAFADLGVYPTNLASDTTFSLMDALSKKTSFATRLAFKAL